MSLRDEMREEQRQAKERMQSGNFIRMWSLTGAKGICDYGKSVIIRLMPRWDYADRYIRDAQNALIDNPAYDKDKKAFVKALEHWWDTPDRKSRQEFCPKSLDQKADCPICEVSASLIQSASKEDRDYGKRIAAKVVFIYNAIVGDPRKIENNLVDIRPISLSPVIFSRIVDIVFGPEDQPNAEKFALGDITDPRTGRDLSLTRPAKNAQGERWQTQPAGSPSKLCGPEQVAAFAGWTERMLDLEKMLKDETTTYNELYKAFHGRDPQPVRGGAASAPASVAAPIQNASSAAVDDGLFGPGRTVSSVAAAAAAVAATVPAEESAAEPESPDDVFVPPPAGARAPRR